MDWDYPASLLLEERDDGPTRSAARMYALEVGEAVARLAGDDPRPLLVVRECNQCKGTDDALLARNLDNEKTLLLSRWFHCVKLKHHVLESDHSFSKLFEGPRPPHLFLCLPDGSNMTPLPGDQNQRELWESMDKVLHLSYERDAMKASKELIKLLSTYDHLDSMEDMYREQLDYEIERRGPDSSKARRLRDKLAEVAKEKKAAKAREEKIVDLRLRDKAEDS